MSTNQGSGPRRRSVTSRQTLSVAVAGRVQHGHARIAELDFMAVAERLEGEGDLGGFVQAVASADPLGE